MTSYAKRQPRATAAAAAAARMATSTAAANAEWLETAAREDARGTNMQRHCPQTKHKMSTTERFAFGALQTAIFGIRSVTPLAFTWQLYCAAAYVWYRVDPIQLALPWTSNNQPAAYLLNFWLLAECFFAVHHIMSARRLGRRRPHVRLTSQQRRTQLLKCLDAIKSLGPGAGTDANRDFESEATFDASPTSSRRGCGDNISFAGNHNNEINNNHQQQHNNGNSNHYPHENNSVADKMMKFISGWHLCAKPGDILRENIVTWFCWAFFDKKVCEMTPDELNEAEKLMDIAEESIGVKFPEGYNPNVHCMRLTIDEMQYQSRPLILYVTLSEFILSSQGFQRHQSHMISYWHRPAPTSAVHLEEGSPEPVVFFHGIGIGLFPYLHFIRLLAENTELFVVDLPFISVSICEVVPTMQEMLDSVEAMLIAHDVAEATFVGHSYGSVIVSWIVKHSKHLVSNAVFVDPVVFLLMLPEVAYNFVYRQPDSFFHAVVHFFASRELYISHTLTRNFIWWQNLCHIESLPPRCTVILSSHDGIVPSHKVRAYIEERARFGTKVVWLENHQHAQFLASPQSLAKVLQATQIPRKKFNPVDASGFYKLPMSRRDRRSAM